MFHSGTLIRNDNGSGPTLFTDKIKDYEPLSEDSILFYCEGDRDETITFTWNYTHNLGSTIEANEAKNLRDKDLEQLDLLFNLIQ